MFVINDIGPELIKCAYWQPGGDKAGAVHRTCIIHHVIDNSYRCIFFIS